MTGLTAACRELDDQIDAMASSELAPQADAAVHLAGCARCRAQLALARRIARTLAATEPPMPPPGFVAAIERRMRRDWWKAEQFIDVTFNLAIAGGLGAILIGTWLLFELSGLTAVTADASNVFLTGLRAAVESVSPRLSTYALAFLLILTTVLVWWWVDDESAG
jgi:hypothetical protein